MAQRTRKTKGRERTLGQAIGLGLLVTLGVALALFLALVLAPGTTLHNMFLLIRHASSATLRADPLFQQYAESIQEQEALFVSPLSLLCGGLTLGRLAPRYATRKRVLLSSAALGFGILIVALGFEWPVAIIQQEGLNKNEGGYIFHVSAPLELIVRQVLWAVAWIAVCVFGAWLGLRLRDRNTNRPADTDTPALRPARHS